MEDLPLPRRFDPAQTPPADASLTGLQARAPTLRPGKQPGPGRLVCRLLLGMLLVSGLLTITTAGLSVYIATRLGTPDPRKPITQTPAALGLAYRDVHFPSRSDHLALSGWFIPGVQADGQLTTGRTIIMVHGHDGNRAHPSVGILDIS